MRREDREVKTLKQIVTIMEQCNVCRIAINNDDYPYILPLNFGFGLEGEQIRIFFHGASEGTKYRLMQKNPKVSFEMDCLLKIREAQTACGYSMEYASVIGNGILRETDPSQKMYALERIMVQCAEDKEWEFKVSVLEKTKVLQLDVIQITGKMTHHR